MLFTLYPLSLFNETLVHFRIYKLKNDVIKVRKPQASAENYEE